MRRIVEEFGTSRTPWEVDEEFVVRLHDCPPLDALQGDTTTIAGARANVSGSRFLCAIPVLVLRSPKGSVGQRGPSCAISLPDESSVLW